MPMAPYEAKVVAAALQPALSIWHLLDSVSIPDFLLSTGVLGALSQLTNLREMDVDLQGGVATMPKWNPDAFPALSKLRAEGIMATCTSLLGSFGPVALSRLKVLTLDVVDCSPAEQVKLSCIIQAVAGGSLSTLTISSKSLNPEMLTPLFECSHLTHVRIPIGADASTMEIIQERALRAWTSLKTFDFQLDTRHEPVGA